MNAFVDLIENVHFSTIGFISFAKNCSAPSVRLLQEEIMGRRGSKALCFFSIPNPFFNASLGFMLLNVDGETDFCMVFRTFLNRKRSLSRGVFESGRNLVTSSKMSRNFCS